MNVKNLFITETLYKVLNKRLRYLGIISFACLPLVVHGTKKLYRKESKYFPLYKWVESYKTTDSTHDEMPPIVDQLLGNETRQKKLLNLFRAFIRDKEPLSPTLKIESPHDYDLHVVSASIMAMLLDEKYIRFSDFNLNDKTDLKLIFMALVFYLDSNADDEDKGIFLKKLSSDNKAYASFSNYLNKSKDLRKAILKELLLDYEVRKRAGLGFFVKYLIEYGDNNENKSLDEAMMKTFFAKEPTIAEQNNPFMDSEYGEDLKNKFNYNTLKSTMYIATTQELESQEGSQAEGEWNDIQNASKEETNDGKTFTSASFVPIALIIIGTVGAIFGTVWVFLKIMMTKKKTTKKSAKGFL